MNYLGIQLQERRKKQFFLLLCDRLSRKENQSFSLYFQERGKKIFKEEILTPHLCTL